MGKDHKHLIINCVLPIALLCASILFINIVNINQNSSHASEISEYMAASEIRPYTAKDNINEKTWLYYGSLEENEANSQGLDGTNYQRTGDYWIDPYTGITVYPYHSTYVDTAYDPTIPTPYGHFDNDIYYDGTPADIAHDVVSVVQNDTKYGVYPDNVNGWNPKTDKLGIPSLENNSVPDTDSLMQNNASDESDNSTYPTTNPDTSIQYPSVDNDSSVQHYYPTMSEVNSNNTRHFKRHRKHHVNTRIIRKHYYYRINGHWVKYRSGHFNRHWKWIPNKKRNKHMRRHKYSKIRLRHRHHNHNHRRK